MIWHLPAALGAFAVYQRCSARPLAGARRCRFSGFRLGLLTEELLAAPIFRPIVGAGHSLAFNNEGENTLTVTNLYIKRKHGAALEEVPTFAFDKDGISAGVGCAPFRQVLIASRPILVTCGLKPGNLRENVLLEDDGLYDLPSGTVVRIGQALIRLTFHCEPCKKILKLIEFDRIVHRRGVFGCFLNEGTMSLGDTLVVTEQKLEPIPYAVKERIRWFLSKGKAPVAARHLIHAIGLPSSYARAMPRLLEKLLPVTRL
jgi:hypothetical protein